MNPRLKFFFILTFIELWWISVWGLLFILVEVLSNKSKTIAAMFYSIVMLLVLLVITRNPELIPHF
jgi:uncharacterized membrane protein